MGTEERQGPHQMGRDALPDAALLQQFADQPQFEIAQITQPPMHQLGIVRAGGMGEVVLLRERYAQSAQCRIARDRGTRRAAADDMDVELFVGEAF